MAARWKTGCGCRSRCSGEVRARTRPDFAVGCRFLADECIEGGSDVRRRGLFRRCNLRKPEWISSRPRAAASSTTPSSRASAARPIPIPGRAATNACRNTFPTSAGRSAATSMPPRRSARRSVPKACRRRSSAPAACIISSLPRQMLADGVCDIVGSARQTLADPDWFLKTQARARRQRAGLRIHQLLRRPRPEAQDRHLPALGQGRSRRSEGEQNRRRQAPPDRAGLDARAMTRTHRDQRSRHARRSADRAQLRPDGDKDRADRRACRRPD